MIITSEGKTLETPAYFIDGDGLYQVNDTYLCLATPRMVSFISNSNNGMYDRHVAHCVDYCIPVDEANINTVNDRIDFYIHLEDLRRSNVNHKKTLP